MSLDRNGGDINADASREVPLYVAKSHWLIKVLVSPPLVMLFVGLFNREEVLEVWETSNWLFRACMVFVGVGIPFGILQTFIQRTEFSAQAIRHRNWWGRWVTRKYDEVAWLKLDPSYLDIVFSDKQKVRIWRSMGDILQIHKIVRQRQNSIDAP